MERALMAAGFGALHYESVGSAGDRAIGLGSGCDRAPDAAARLVQPVDDLAIGEAERERDDVGPLPRRKLELRVPVVVRPAWPAGVDPVPVCFLPHSLGIRVERSLVDVFADRIEEVQADGLRAQSPQLAQVALDGR